MHAFKLASASITFFYYDDLNAPATSYSNVMRFKLVDDQKWAKIYQINGNAFLGIVDGKKGFCKVQDKNAVLLTLVVDDVHSRYTYFKDNGINLVGEVQKKEDIQVHCFFLKDPGGYVLEVQQFLNPEIMRVFG